MDRIDRYNFLLLCNKVDPSSIERMTYPRLRYWAKLVEIKSKAKPK